MNEPLKRKDYLAKAEPRWCAGCGDYSVLKSMTKAFQEMELKRENTVMVSGIGCAARFPYYTSTYGFHTLHGRAPTVATGIKVARPDLSVWMITGDGDALSIGGNHFMHMMRRNPDINVILFNNRIYGLTKGQTSPTSPKGTVTKSTPFGSVDKPINPIAMAITSGATFVARVADTNGAMMVDMFKQAYAHKGVSFIEILQACPIFNDGDWDAVTKKSNQAEATVNLIHGEVVKYGAENNKGLRVNGFKLEKATISGNGTDKDLLVWDAEDPDSTLAMKMACLEFPKWPYPVGIFRKIKESVYETSVHLQEVDAAKKIGKSNLKKLFGSGETWQVMEDEK